MTLVPAALLLALLTASASGVAAEQQAPAAKPSMEERITSAAKDAALPIDWDGSAFSGPGWSRLIDEGRAAQFFAVGEEHGIAENPRLTAALFSALQPAGYARMTIEVSPPIARELDHAARKGMEGLLALYALPGGEPAFFGMEEEAQLLVAARRAVESDSPIFWGVDYEVGGDRLLIERLRALSKPSAAEKALATLARASAASWEQYESTRDPRFIFSFAGDPALVRAVRDAWPDRSAVASLILDTLEETFAINRAWISGEGWASNARRSAFIRDNFLRYWRAEKAMGRAPRVLAKMGASHLVRGLNMSSNFDLGSLLPEIAALEGRTSFHLLVLAGAGSQIAVFDPTGWSYKPMRAKGGVGAHLGPITAAADPARITLVDLRPLRPLAASSSGVHPDLRRVVFGFDALLVLSGSTPSANVPRTAPKGSAKSP